MRLVQSVYWHSHDGEDYDVLVWAGTGPYTKITRRVKYTTPSGEKNEDNVFVDMKDCAITDPAELQRFFEEAVNGR